MSTSVDEMYLLSFLSGLWASSTVLAETCNWQYDTFYGCDFTYGHVIETLYTIRSVMECNGRCNENDECMSVKFDTVSKTCQLNSKTATPPPGQLCPKTYRYAVLTTSPCRKLIKRACAVTADCSEPNSLCVENKCQCDHGYSYNPRNDDCVANCDEYGSTFTIHLGFGIAGKNDIVLREVSTKEDCVTACLGETTLVCKTADYDAAALKCMLSTDTALTAPSRYGTYDKYDHYHRNCQ